MIRSLKVCFTILLVLFSFFYTEKVSNIMLEKNGLYSFIKKISKKYYVKPQNAIIHDDEIIPGLYGRKVDIIKSYKNMKDCNCFNEKLIIYKYIKPTISIDNYKNYYVIKGNENKREISFVLNNNEQVKQYFNDNKIPYSNKKICINDQISKDCDYKIKPLFLLSNNSYLLLKDKIDNGSIIIMDNTVTVDIAKIILKEVNYRDLRVVRFEDLIKER